MHSHPRVILVSPRPEHVWAASFVIKNSAASMHDYNSLTKHIPLTLSRSVVQGFHWEHGPQGKSSKLHWSLHQSKTSPCNCKSMGWTSLHKGWILWLWRYDIFIDIVCSDCIFAKSDGWAKLVYSLGPSCNSTGQIMEFAYWISWKNGLELIW